MAEYDQRLAGGRDLLRLSLVPEALAASEEERGGAERRPDHPSRRRTNRPTLILWFAGGQDPDGPVAEPRSTTGGDRFAQVGISPDRSVQPTSDGAETVNWPAQFPQVIRIETRVGACDSRFRSVSTEPQSVLTQARGIRIEAFDHAGSERTRRLGRELSRPPPPEPRRTPAPDSRGTAAATGERTPRPGHGRRRGPSTRVRMACTLRSIR